MKPLIRPGGLSHSWYLLTRYTVKDDAIVASTKYDITDQIDAIIEQATADQAKRLDRIEAAAEVLIDAWLGTFGPDGYPNAMPENLRFLRDALAAR